MCREKGDIRSLTALHQLPLISCPSSVRYADSFPPRGSLEIMKN